MISWKLISAEFAWEGSWRDVCVSDTTAGDWIAVLQALQRSEFSTHWQSSGLAANWLEDPGALFNRDAAPAPLMSVSAGSVQLNCHFFCANEIEFDLDPREVHGQADLDALLSFMEMIAVATAKPVLMTPENMHDSPFIRVVSPETAEYIPSLGMFEEMAKNRT